MEKMTIFDKSFTTEEIKEIFKMSGRSLKTGKRSEVKEVKYRKKDIVVKIPVEKNRRKWQRFLSIFRKSEVISILESMKILQENGILTNNPIAAYEKKEFGMVIDSFAVYGYVNGDVVTKHECKEVVELIKKIHNTGYLHSDTQVRNFLKCGDKIAVIDAKLKRKSLGGISENLEYIGFAVDINEAYGYINKNTVFYKIAKFLYELFRFKRRVRHYFKNRKN